MYTKESFWTSFKFPNIIRCFSDVWRKIIENLATMQLNTFLGEENIEYWSCR
jgi:hypothetical protein